ncbi:MAG: hypothetical protein R3A10_23525 [Caldilineaceae bacterium]
MHPDSADPEDVYKNAGASVLAEVCDAINATDGSKRQPPHEQLRCCALLTRGLLNRLPGQLPGPQPHCHAGRPAGAAALLGIKNVLCPTGDDASAGDQPRRPSGAFDLDSSQLLRTAHHAR